MARARPMLSYGGDGGDAQGGDRAGATAAIARAANARRESGLVLRRRNNHAIISVGPLNVTGGF